MGADHADPLLSVYDDVLHAVQRADLRVRQDAGGSHVYLHRDFADVLLRHADRVPAVRVRRHFAGLRERLCVELPHLLYRAFGDRARLHADSDVQAERERVRRRRSESDEYVQEPRKDLQKQGVSEVLCVRYCVLHCLDTVPDRSSVLCQGLHAAGRVVVHVLPRRHDGAFGVISIQ